MLHRPRQSPRGSRRGAATVELAVMLPLLAFLFVIGTDFARIFYHYLTITNCARNGALYGSGSPIRAVDLIGIKAAALADASNLSPEPNVISLIGVGPDGHPYLDVTVTYPFKTISKFPGVPSNVDLTRTVRMRVAPTTPKNS